MRYPIQKEKIYTNKSEFPTQYQSRPSKSNTKTRKIKILKKYDKT